MNYICPVCKQIYNKPATISCGHQMCYNCVKSFCNNAKLVCPICKQEYDNININQLHIDHQLDEICQKIQTYQKDQRSNELKQQQGYFSNTMVTQHTSDSLGNCMLSTQSQLDKSINTQHIKLTFQGEELIQAYKQLSNDLQAKLDKLQANYQSSDSDAEIFKDNISNITQKINYQFDQLVQKINKRKNEILYEVQQIYDKYMNIQSSKQNIIHQTQEQLNTITKQSNLENEDYAEKYQQIQQLSENLDISTIQPILQLDCIFQQSINQEIQTHGKLIVQQDAKSKLRQQQQLLNLPHNYVYYDLQHPRDLDNPQSADSFIQLCLCRMKEQQQSYPKQYIHAISSLIDIVNTEQRDKQSIQNQETAAYIVGYLGNLVNIPQELFSIVQKQFNSIIHSYQNQLKKCNAQIAILRNYSTDQIENSESNCPANHRIFSLPNYSIAFLSYLSKAYGNIQKVIQQQIQNMQEKLQHIQQKSQHMAQQYNQKKQSLVQLHEKLQKNQQLHDSEIEKLSNLRKSAIQNTQQDQIKDISNKVNELEQQVVLLKQQFETETEKLMAYELGLRREYQNMIKSLVQLKKQQISDNEAVNNIVCQGAKNFASEINKEINQIIRNGYIQAQDQYLFNFELKVLFNAFLEYLPGYATTKSQLINQIMPIQINSENCSENSNQNNKVNSEFKQKNLQPPTGAIGLCIAKQNYNNNSEENEIKVIQGESYWLFKYEEEQISTISSLKYPKICFEVPSSIIQLTKHIKQDFEVEIAEFQMISSDVQRNLSRNQFIPKISQQIANIPITEHIQTSQIINQLTSQHFSGENEQNNKNISKPALGSQKDFLKLANAKFAFTANDDNDLETIKGDQLIIYNVLEGNEWYKAKNLRTNAIGLIPVSYID